MTNVQFWIYIIAVILSPLIAVQISVWLQRRREDQNTRLWVFKTLMSTRASRLSENHVHALNMIDLEFYGQSKKSKAVIEAWKAYHYHLSNGTPSEAWHIKEYELFMDLLFYLAEALGYHFGKTELKQTSYFPQGFKNKNDEMSRIHKGVLSIVEGKTPLLVTTPYKMGPEGT
ncbi:MAG: hypothetical protein QG657_4051 [Acidobacteriota bacterium]|nr:hypothetical protein [Acidobacteriota bacterium]